MTSRLPTCEAQSEPAAGAVTTTQTDNEAVDSLDWQIILFVHDHRREYGTGPWWSEVRAHLGLPFVSYSTPAFKKWRANQDSTQRRSRRAWRKGVLQNDPLVQRFFKLRRLGFLNFTGEERSLDVAVEPPEQESS